MKILTVNFLKKIFGAFWEQRNSSPDMEDRLDDKAVSPRPYIIFGLVTILVFFGGFGAWATLAQLEGAIISPGFIKVEKHRKDVQHLEGGIVDKILIRDGDVVEKGDVLLTLHSAQINSNVDLLQGQYHALLAMKARLEAESQLQDTIFWPDEVPIGQRSQLIDKLWFAEQQVFDSRKKSLQGQLALLETQTQQIKEQIRGLKERLSSEEQIILIIKEELKAKEQLLKERYLEKTPVLELRRSLASHEGALSTIRGEIAQNKERIAEIRVRMNELTTAYVKEAVSQLSEVQNKLFDIEDRLRPQVDAKKRLTVRAPVGGTIVDLRVFSEGGVIRSGETLMQIVPDEEPLIIECDVRPQDISKVYQTQAARVQLNAFNTREVQPVDGKVSYVAADSVLIRTPYGEQPAYKINVELNRKQIDDQGITISPGMPVTVFLSTGERTFLDYMLDPLIENFRQALRE